MGALPCTESCDRGTGLSAEVCKTVNQHLYITYHYHSGFSVNLGDTLLVFDYWQGEHKELPQQSRLTPEILSGFAHVYVFISHSHPDHFDPVVYEWRNLTDVTYLVSYEMPVGTRGRRMSPGDHLILSDRLQVWAYDSTDLGVSFLVEADGLNLFHAGDLNFWHWREESSLKDIEEAEQAFHRAVADIPKDVIDVAFFPVDPRQGQMYDAGANYFILSTKPRLVIPMHFWGSVSTADEFARRGNTSETMVTALTRSGEYMEITMAEDGGMRLYVHRLEHVMPYAGESPLPVAEDDPEEEPTQEGGNPFADADLPVPIE